MANSFPERGFTLIEVLISILILAAGAAGVAAMQLQALRLAQQSGLQSDAVQLAAELAELMHADGEALLFSDVAGAAGGAVSPGCSGNGCALAAWQRDLADALPQARAAVCRDDAPLQGDELRWSCSNSGDSPVAIKLGWSGRDAKNSGQPAVVLLTEP